MINGDETYTLKNAGGAVVGGPTPAFNTAFLSHQRNDPEAAPWTLDAAAATPGSGVEAPDGVYSGLVISEASDASGSGNYIYEFVELYYDADAGTGGNWRIDDNFPDPIPATPTSETSWNSQLSSWGYELYLLGHTVRSNTAAFTAAS
ncbi:hypothetical protein GW813_03790, partial [bacterium]|nr:hypothetical protein [bacterium]